MCGNSVGAMFSRVGYLLQEYPYFVSDVTGKDFEWTLAELKKLGDVFGRMYEKLSERLKKVVFASKFA